MKKLLLVILVLALASLSAFAQEPAAPKADPAKPDAANPVEMPVPPTPPELPDKTRFEGVIINMQGMAAGASFFSVQIDRWSTPDEIRELKSAFANQGTQGALDKTWDAKPVGFMKISNSLGKPLRFARAIPVPGGYIVRVLTDTPVSHVGTRSRDYPFGYIEMVVPTDGTKGHGTLIGMAKFSFDEKGNIQIAAYGTMPVRLEEVVIDKPKK